MARKKVEAPQNQGVSDFFSIGEDEWEKDWQGMPEFSQKDLSPFKTVYIHFACREDMESFSKLVGQSIGIKTRSIWYPKAEIGMIANKRYINEE